METWIFVSDDTEVSSAGRVRKYVTGHTGSGGYTVLSGGKRGAPKQYVHILVAKAFHGERPEGCVVRHLNDDKTDNRADNLAYGSKSENYFDAVINGKLDPRSPDRLAHLQSIASSGGKWWLGKKRDGQRGGAK